MASRRRLVERFTFASSAFPHRRLSRRPLLEALEGRALLATFTVNSLGDVGSGSGKAGDLRYCIDQANSNDQANTIVFDPSEFGIQKTITLNGGQLELSDTGGTQSIIGPAAGVTISGGGNSQVFQVDGGVTASFSGLTISSGSAAYQGGGLSNYGTASLTDCAISGNTVSRIVVTNAYGSSDTNAQGGGVFNGAGANLTLTDCTISGNSAFSAAREIIPGYDPTYYYKFYGNGGGVFNSGTATLTGCTVSGNNTGTAGGGVFNSGTINLTDSTVSGNFAGGDYNDGTATLTDTIVAGNNGGDIGGFANVLGTYNLIGTGGSGGLTNGVNGNIVLTTLNGLDLAPLGNFGGPTQTMALLPGSPAIGAGVIADYPGTTTPITTDQRGEPLDSPNPDVGAYQTQDPTLIPVAFSGISNQSITFGTSSVTISGTLSDGTQALVGESVAVTLDSAVQSAAIGTGGAFSTTFDTTGLAVASTPYAITYSYTSDGTFASASTASTLTVNPAGPIILTVDSLGDAGIGSADAGDLRYCINQANSDDQANQIVFDPTVFSTPQTITLSGTQLWLEDTGGTQTITGPAAGVTISGGGTKRVLQVDGGVIASFSGLTITGGSATHTGGGLVNDGTATLTDCTISGSTANAGGGVYNGTWASLTMTNCNVSGNTAGGGVYSGSYTSLTMTNCTVSDNSSEGKGGGVFARGFVANLIDCTVSDNTAGWNGGGVANSGQANLTLTDCAVSGNTSLRNGGGLASYGQTSTLIDCTISGNHAAYGGGVSNYFATTLTLTDSTVSGNIAKDSGGGVFNYGTVNLTDTIVAGNTTSSGASDIDGQVSGSDNLIGTGGSGGLVNGVNGNIVLNSLTGLGLAPLANNGGPTQTMALRAGSAAIAAGTQADYPGTTTPITTDQRGEPLDTPNPDIGAFQVQGSGLIALTFSGLGNPTVAFGSPSVTISGTLASGTQAPVGESVIVTLDGVQQSAAIGSGGAFSTTFDSTGINVINSTFTVSYYYSSDGTFAPASTTSTLTVGPGALRILTVDSLGDEGSGAGLSGDLRYCINQANTDEGPNTIVFDPNVFSTPQTITLDGGTLELEDTEGTQTIIGPALGVTISGGGSSRVFQVNNGVTASFSGLTVTDGSAAVQGGGLANYGTATLSDCVISGNTAFGTISYGYYSRKPYSSTDEGGGVFNGASATLTLTGCTISGNSAVTEIERSGYYINYYKSYGNGGGVFNFGTATLTGCTVSGNNAGVDGGGLDNFGTVNLTDSTISGNENGGVINSGNAYLTDCTVSNNANLDGLQNGGLAILTNTIVADNKGGDIGGSAYVVGSYNLIGTGGSGGLINGVNGNIVLTSLTGLGLAPLGSYGGPTQTMALLPGSAAIGAGVIADYPGTTIQVTTDQRGEPLDSPNPDIGAYQTQNPALIPLAFSGIRDQSITFGTSSVTISGTLAAGSQAPVGETVTVTFGGVEQSAAIGTGGAFSTTFDTTDLAVAATPYTITYSYTSDGTFASASATSAITVNPVGPTIFTVNSLGDAGIGSEDAGDLRYCINQANSDDQAIQIVFDPTVFSTPQTITLLGTQLWLEDTGGTQTITGPAAGVTISSGRNGSVFQVESGVTASISGLTLSGGSVGDTGGGLVNDGTVTLADCTISDFGTGLVNVGTASLTECTINGNTVDGGVLNSANLTLTDCTVSGNSSGSFGGGVFNSGTANLTDSVISGNSSGSTGGGVFNGSTATLTLTACTISGNTGVSGGGLGNYGGTCTLIASTVSGNYAENGGGAYNYFGSANLTLTNCTFSGNIAAESGGGVFNYGTVSLTDSIVAGNSGGDIGGASNVSGSYNLIGTGGSGGLVNGVNGNIVLNSLTGLGLAPLANNGGPTQTMALLAGSPAIAAGVVADQPGTTTPITTDQRGEPLDTPSPDIGAYQIQGSGLIALSFSGLTNASITFGSPTLTISGTLANGTQAPVGESIIVTLDGVQQSAAIKSGGAFSTTFDATGLNVVDSPYTVSYYYTGDGTFAPASTTSVLTVVPAALTIFTVDSLGDAGSGSGFSGDLRYCINEANDDGGANTIVFDPNLFSTPQTITLSGSPLELTNTGGTQTITGPTAGVTISGGGNSDVFAVDSGVTASISGLTITDGSTGLDGGGLLNLGTATLTDCAIRGNNAGYGGGVFNSSTASLTLTDCTVSGNTGDGLANSGYLALTDCTVSSNDGEQTLYGGGGGGGGGYGGGGYGGGWGFVGSYGGGDGFTGNGGGGVNNSGTANLTNCTISGNSSLENGGGLANYGGTISLDDCTVSDNIQRATSGYGGGGVFNADGTAALTDCTFSGNSSAVSGGAVENGGAIYLTACTLSDNSSPDSGGLDNGFRDIPAAAYLTDTIVAGNTNSDIGGTSDVSGSYNLIGTGGSGGLVNGVDGNIVLTSLTGLGLAPLANNGGPTQTMALLSGSPAIGAGVIADYPGTTTPITTDQRGEPLDTPNPDIGAFQTQVPPLVKLPFSQLSNPSITYGASSVTITGTLANGSQTPIGESVAVTLDGDQQSAIIGVDGKFSTTFDMTDLTVAASPYTITYAYTSDGSYASSNGTSTMTVSPATITISAHPATKIYGTADPALAYTASGFEFDDTAATVLTGVLTRAEAATLGGEQVGRYAITQGTLAADSNYTIAFIGNTLNITPATLHITGNAQTKVYGTGDPALTDTATGFVRATVDGVNIGDTAATILTGSLARAQAGTLAGEQVGDYAISQGTLAASGNYTIAFTGGTLTIAPAPLTVTANPQTKVYGTADPALTDVSSGFVDTTVDGVAIVDTATTALSGQLTRTPGETVAGSPYTITQGTLAANNYTITYTAAALTITPAKLTILAEPESKVFGFPDPTLAYTSSGFEFSDTAATVLTGSLTRAAGDTVSGGPYAIGQGTLTADGNYTIDFIGNFLSITRALPAVFVSAPGGTYTGAPIAAATTLTGVGGAAVRSLEGVTPTLTYYAGTGTSDTSLGSTAPSAVGTYTVVASFAGSADYATAESQAVTYVIAPATAKIALSSSIASPVYGQSVTFVATVNSTSGTAFGTVTFFDGGTKLSTVPLDSSGQAAVTFATLSMGSHAITATYNGGADFLAVSSGAAAESVSQSATAIVLVPRAVLGGKKNVSAVGYTAEIEPVAPGAGVPTGQVIFEFVTKHRNKVSVKMLGTGELIGGRATLTFKTNQLLNKPLTIVYSGDPDFLASEMSPPTLTKSSIARFRV
jgi:hypothetical protein